METLATQLYVYGPLGILCVMLAYGVVHLYRKNQELNEKILDLVEKHAEKAEGWVEKGTALATNAQSVLQAIVNRPQGSGSVDNGS